MATPTPKPGLQIERTHLAWERTAIGFLAVAAIILFHHQGPIGEPRVVLASVAITMALSVFGISRLRGRISVRTVATGRSVVRGPDIAVRLIGWGTCALAICLLAALMVNR
jgi:uncharacterized membrane protein YidH (DUF202 family)